MMRQLLIVFCLVLAGGSARALDTEITILALTTGGADQNFAMQNIQYLQQNWATAAGVTVKFANGGDPVALPGAFLIGTASQQLQEVSAHPQWSQFREQYAADVVIVFTNVFSDNFCGYAEQPNWIGAGASFEPDPTDDNLDRRGKDDYFRAIVRTNPSFNCQEEIIEVLAAHEFGHLLGGGHTKESGDQYLFTDSHAFAIIFNIFGVINGSKSILAEGSPKT